MSRPVLFDAWGKAVGHIGAPKRAYPMPGDIPAELACKGCNGEGRVAIGVVLSEDRETVLSRKVLGGFNTVFNEYCKRAAQDRTNTFRSPILEQEEHRACGGTGFAVRPPGHAS